MAEKKTSTKKVSKKESTTAYKWWHDKEFVAELDRRYDAMESGEDKGVTLDEFKISIETKVQKL